MSKKRCWAGWRASLWPLSWLKTLRINTGSIACQCSGIEMVLTHPGIINIRRESYRVVSCRIVCLVKAWGGMPVEKALYMARTQVNPGKHKSSQTSVKGYASNHYVSSDLI